MKKLLIIVLSVFMLVMFVSCTERLGNNAQKNTDAVSVTVTANKTTASVGEKIQFTLHIDGAPKAKSVGIELQYDKDYFELIDGEMELQGDLSDFSDGIGVVAFSEATDVNTDILAFTLKAKSATPAEESVKCKVSIKDKNNESVEIKSSNNSAAQIQIK